MPAAQLPDAARPGTLFWFAAIGLGATVLYAILALLFERGLGVKAVVASVLAYAIAGSFSYLGHKVITFASAADHRREAPRFAATALVGLAIATGAPGLLTHLLGLPSWAAVAFTCLAVPAASFTAMQRWVFARPAGPQLTRAPAGRTRA
jgi:putative flippase GtrA